MSILSAVGIVNQPRVLIALPVCLQKCALEVHVRRKVVFLRILRTADKRLCELHPSDSNADGSHQRKSNRNVQFHYGPSPLDFERYHRTLELRPGTAALVTEIRRFSGIFGKKTKIDA